MEWERLEISLRKLRDTKGTFHAKMGTIKERNGKDLTEAEEIKRRQEYKKNCTIKVLTWITRMVPSLTLSQTPWSVKSSGS